MRRILYYSLLCLLWVSVNSCKDDEASQPPTPSFTVEPKSGLMANTEFTFVVEQVSAGTISVLPYGAENVNDAGIIIPQSSFTNGKATVTFKYGRVGTFNPVVVANNHTGDGNSIKNAVSASQSVVITNDQTAITDFSFDGSSKTTIDADNFTVVVEMPWDKGQKIATLAAKFALSPFATAKVGGTAQESEKTSNNFGTLNSALGTVTPTPVVYTITSQNGLLSKNWTVTVNVKPIQTTNTVKGITGIIAKKGAIPKGVVGSKVQAGRALPGYVDNANRRVILYDTLGAYYAQFDSVALDYSLNGDLSYAKYDQSPIKRIKGKDTVNLKTPFKFVVTPQDSTPIVTGPVAGQPTNGRATYTVQVTDAPAIEVSFLTLNPNVVNTNLGHNFDVEMKVLSQTPTTIPTTLDFTIPADAAVWTPADVKVGGVLYTPGMVVDYAKPVKVEITVHKTAGYDFVATYTISVTPLK